jgi:hypothetical protein
MEMVGLSSAELEALRFCASSDVRERYVDDPVFETVVSLAGRGLASLTEFDDFIRAEPTTQGRLLLRIYDGGCW